MADSINPSIYKAYDIRGVYPTELDEETAYRTGRAFVQLLGNETGKAQVSLGVANDMRLSSPQIKGALIHGMLDQGAIVYDIGFSTTPSFYFAVGFYGFDGGVQVSASHNPKQYNGFKLVRRNAVPVSETSGIFDIRDMAIKNVFTVPAQAGIYRTVSPVVETEAQKFLADIPKTAVKPFKIVVDTANSASALDLEAFFGQFPQIEVVKLNFDLDGNFPVHDPDPLKDENLVQLQKAVLEHHADLGLAPDGDGDRYFVVDEKGQIVRQEILRGIMAQIAIKENSGATVCYDIRPGRITKDMIEEAGGKASVTRVGHSLIKEQMLKENAVFGGESSGHYFYQTQWGTFEVPFLLLSKFLVYLSSHNQPLSAVIKPLQRYHHSGEINSDVKDQQGKIKLLAETYADAEISDLDGITITYPDYWFNVRASNTEPKLRLNLEAKTPELMAQKRDEVLKLIRS